ncbi:hypothetical protein [Massilia sp. IC2-476]|uniref:hypothetical protein n=1 Tax=Massilia sp. IC2-476 TaxID=2887199 RepID=UPI001D10845B|nr:hypothetical protein [Massilia sp. IC2-476]MCC2971794.1 hypothetical protein [Massilia sp. IC2-476]
MVDQVTAINTFWDLKASGALKFISDSISALAWPVVIFFTLRLFKAEVVKLLAKLSKVSALGVEAEFNQGLDKVEAAVQQLPDNGSTDVPSSPSNVPADETSQVTPPTTTVASDFEIRYSVEGAAASDPVALRANPTGTVMEAWKSLEQTLRFFAAEVLGPVESSLSPSVLVANLYSSGAIPLQQVSALTELIKLRNLAAHSTDPIPEAEAEKFAKLARQLASEYKDRRRLALIRRVNGRLERNSNRKSGT